MLSRQFGNGKPLLKQCALLSSSFLLPSRKQLYSEIILKDKQGSQRLHEHFVQNPLAVMLSFVGALLSFRRLGIQKRSWIADRYSPFFDSRSAV